MFIGSVMDDQQQHGGRLLLSRLLARESGSSLVSYDHRRTRKKRNCISCVAVGR